MATDAELLAAAVELAVRITDWRQLTSAIYDPVGGLITGAYRERSERERFIQTEEYRAIRELVNVAYDRWRTAQAAAVSRSAAGQGGRA